MAVKAILGDRHFDDIQRCDLAFVIWLGIKAVVNIVKPPVQATNIDVGNFDLKAPKAGVAAGGGGGGGSHDVVDPIKGKLPPRMKDPITPPMVPILDQPKLAVPSAINVQQNIQLPDNPNMPNIGMAKSANVTLDSNGQGGGSGMGTGYGGGMGSGTGNGFGPGRAVTLVVECIKSAAASRPRLRSLPRKRSSPTRRGAPNTRVFA